VGSSGVGLGGGGFVGRGVGVLVAVSMTGGESVAPRFLRETATAAEVTVGGRVKVARLLAGAVAVGVVLPSILVGSGGAV